MDSSSSHGGRAQANPFLPRECQRSPDDKRPTADESRGRLFAGRELSPRERAAIMILPQVHLRKPCYDFYFL